MKKTMTMSVRRAFSMVLALLMVVGILPVFATPVDATVPSCSGLLMKNAFPDAAFRNYVWTEVLHHDGTAPDNYRLSFPDSYDVATKTYVDVSGLGIKSLEGIKYFCALIDFDCSENEIEELDLRLNVFLKKLDASKNALTELDLSRNNILAVADLSGQTVEMVLGLEIDLFEIAGRRDLFNVRVDGERVDDYNRNSGILVLEKLPEKSVSYSAPVNNKRFELEVTLVQMSIEGLTLEEVFPDEAFAKYIWAKVLDFSTAFKYDYELKEADVKKIKEEKVLELKEKGIKSLEGIEHFSKLEKLFAAGNDIEEIVLSANAELIEVDLSANKKLEKLDVKCLKNLKELKVAETKISTLELSKLKKLEVLDVTKTAFKTLDVTANTKLVKLYCRGLGLTSLDVYKNTDLKLLDCSYNALTSLYLAKNTKLTELYCSYNALTGLNLGKCHVTTFEGKGQEKTIELTGSSINLEKLAGDDVKNVKLNGKDAGKLFDSKTGVLSFNGPVWNISYDAEVNSGSKLLSVSLKVQDKLSGKELGELFPDDDFAKFVWTKVLGHTSSSYDDDNELTVREIYTIAGVENLDVSDEEIESLAGIKHFTSLKSLDCSENYLKTLDLSGNAKLERVDCSDNKLTTIDVTENENLRVLICDNNKLTSINLIYNDKIEKLDVSYNELTSLNVTKNDELDNLDCSHNKLTSLNLTKNEDLDVLDCSYNSLVYIDLSENTGIDGKSSVNCNDQTVYVEVMTYTVDLEKITGVDDDLITVKKVNGKKTGFEVKDGTVISDEWIKDLEYEVEIHWGTSSSKSEEMSVKLVNVYATEGYTVTYKPGAEGEGDCKIVYKAKNKTLVLEDALFTRVGYVQIGWTTKDGGELVYELGEDYTANKSVTLYPVWGADTYTVKFDANGGTLRSITKTVTYGSKYGKLPTPTREGYDFAGWYTAKTGGEKVVAGTVVTIRSNHTLYAHWTKEVVTEKYTIEFIVNGGTPISVFEGTKGTKVDLSECVTKREGYKFEGWYLDAALTKKVTTVTLTSDIKVYAKWSATSAAGSMSNFKQHGVYGGYADVDESLWYGTENQGVIRDVTLLGIMVGDGVNFRPTDDITIAEIVKMAAVVHNTYYGGLYTFDQTAGSYWFDTYIEYAVNNGIIKAGEFADYTAKATRAEMAYIFANALPEKEFAPISSLRPSDVDLNDKYVDEIAKLYAAGVITGTNAAGDFVGDRTITRAEAAAIIVRVALTAKRIAK